MQIPLPPKERYEDAIAVVRAAETLGDPVILMTNKDAVNFIPIELIGPMLITMAKNASVPVCVHLDHSRDFNDIQRAIAAGYTSVMYDGSQLAYEENLRNTKEVVDFAHGRGVSVEAEIGSVGYSDPAMIAKAEYTDPDQAAQFASITQVDALAVAVGTVHRMKLQEAKIDFLLLERIKRLVDVPLVIHGSSGAKDADISRMCEIGAMKINLGTTLRMAFGNTLRRTIAEMPDEFDRLKLFPTAMKAVTEKAIEKMILMR